MVWIQLEFDLLDVRPILIHHHVMFELASITFERITSEVVCDCYIKPDDIKESSFGLDIDTIINDDIGI